MPQRGRFQAYSHIATSDGDQARLTTTAHQWAAEVGLKTLFVVE